MEFLLSYGWAIVVVISAIAALAYFGVPLTPSGFAAQYFPEQCTIDSGLACMDHSVRYNQAGFNTLDLKIKNNVGYDIIVSTITLPDFGNRLDNIDQTVANGNWIEIPTVMDMTNAASSGSLLQKGSSYEINFILIVKNSQSGLEHEFHGVIKGKVN
jgi:hypothetical protein